MSFKILIYLEKLFKLRKNTQETRSSLQKFAQLYNIFCVSTYHNPNKINLKSIKMKTLIVGASSNPERYAYKAANSLLAYGHEIELVGQSEGIIKGHKIKTDYPDLDGVDTITLYVGLKNQPSLYDYILNLKPRRIIFNPGTESQEFEQLALDKGIQVEEACTLVLLATGQY